MRWLLLLLVISAVYAAVDTSSILLPQEDVAYVTLLDAETSAILKKAYVTLNLDNKSLDIRTDEEGRFGISMINGTVELELLVDLLSTEGKDFYAKYTLARLEGDIELPVYRVGSIKGNVYDSNNNLIPNAEIEISCTSDIGEDEPTRTNQYGFYEMRFAPLGPCTIMASYGESIGSSELFVEHGLLAKGDVVLASTFVRKDFSWILLLSIPLAGVALYVFLRRRKPLVTQRKEDIITGLDAKEKNVVRYLIESGKRVSQNELSREVGIPKSSLCRVVENLESKNIVESEQIGKFKKIWLSKEFLKK